MSSHPQTKTSSSSSSKPKKPTPSTSSSQKQYYLIRISTPLRTPTNESEIDLHAESWKLPYNIDDSDLTFDGKPLNMLYEENRWEAEHCNSTSSYSEYHYSSSSGSSSSSSGGALMMEHKSRGRSRQSKK